MLPGTDQGGVRVPQPVPRPDVYADLRQKIIALDHQPGVDLDEGALVETYGVSRTPIREALIRLAAEGLVVIKRNRGAYVAPLDVATLRAYFEAAEFVTRAIVRLAALRGSERDLATIESAMVAFEDAVRRDDARAMVEQNDRFHDAISAASGNKYLYDAARRILADHQRIAQLCYSHEIATRDDRAMDITVAQHRALFSALRKGDATAAEEVAIDHLGLCKEGLRDILTATDGALAGLMIEADAA